MDVSFNEQKGVEELDTIYGVEVVVRRMLREDLNGDWKGKNMFFGTRVVRRSCFPRGISAERCLLYNEFFPSQP